MTPDEFASLVQSARDSGEDVQGYDGELRARVYLLSYLTGLRCKELASLTPGSYDLDAKYPILQVEAACSKHRKTDVLPLHPERVTMLKDWLEGCQRALKRGQREAPQKGPVGQGKGGSVRGRVFA